MMDMEMRKVTYEEALACVKRSLEIKRAAEKRIVLIRSTFINSIFLSFYYHTTTMLSILLINSLLFVVVDSIVVVVKS